MCFVGLCHAVYRTQGFPQGIRAHDDRDVLRELVGQHAEDVVYVYCSCGRSCLYFTIATPGAFRFRHPFTGHVFEPSEQVIRDLLGITLSNEVGLGSLNQDCVEKGRRVFQNFMPRCKPYVSQPALNRATNLFNLPM